jgi:cytochrome oxidase Cu insertion factor (SCO1/SenC/PrrC family)
MRPRPGWARLMVALVLVSHGCGVLRHRRQPADENLAADGLAVGRVAPDIEGQDLDGTPLRLSDYRGQVVVLDFWGTW